MVIGHGQAGAGDQHVPGDPYEHLDRTGPRCQTGGKGGRVELDVADLVGVDALEQAARSGDPMPSWSAE